MYIFNNIINRFQLKLKDRYTAGNILTEGLKDVMKKEKDAKKSYVLGIPRGGVIIAEIIARRLPCGFGVIIPRKLSAPHNEELGIGAVMGDGTIYVNEALIKDLGISRQYVENEKFRQLHEMTRRTSLYCSGNRVFSDCEKIDLANRTVVLADDGAATGATIIAAARWIRATKNPFRVIIAIPVIPKETLKLIEKEVDINHIEAIITPPMSRFKSVEQYYHRFEQLTDKQVIKIIDRNVRYH